MHTRNSLELLDGNSTAIKMDKEKGKLLRKIVKKQRKREQTMTPKGSTG